MSVVEYSVLLNSEQQLPVDVIVCVGKGNSYVQRAGKSGQLLLNSGASFTAR